MNLLDKSINALADELKGKISWLDNSYSRSERLAKTDMNGRRYYLPVIYSSGNNYKLLTPDSKDGNFCFFVVRDPFEVGSRKFEHVRISANISAVFWFNYNKVMQRENIRLRSDIAAKIIKVLNDITLPNAMLRVNRCYELAEHIYEGFSLDEVNNQFLMHPYGGLRVDFEIRVLANCNELC